MKDLFNKARIVHESLASDVRDLRLHAMAMNDACAPAVYPRFDVSPLSQGNQRYPRPTGNQGYRGQGRDQQKPRSGNNRTSTCFRCGRAGHLRAQRRASCDIRGNEMATIATKTEEQASDFQEYESQLIGDQCVLVDRSQPRCGNGIWRWETGIFSR